MKPICRFYERSSDHSPTCGTSERGSSVSVAMRGMNAAAIGALAAIALVGGRAASAWRTPAPAPTHLRFVIDGRSIARRFPQGPSVAFRYPANWHVTRRRLDDVLDPRTLFAVSTYKLPSGPRDDCDGTHARGRPADGAFALVKEVLDQASLRRSLPRLPKRPRHLHLPTPRSPGRAGCLAPPSIAYQFRVAQRAFYVWISVGPRASASTRRALSAVLDRMWIGRYSKS